MPVYNGARFLGKAIESVLAQRFQDWELIVINDGSTDGTREVLAKLTDARIRVFHQANNGEAVARNRGLGEVCGEYVAFLDADDLYLPNALDDMVAYLDAHREADVLITDGYFCDENEQTLGLLSEVRPGPYTGNILEPLILDPAVIAGIICTMTRHTTIQRTGVRFDHELVIGPDWDFWIHLARFARFSYLDRPTCIYRIHATNTTKTTKLHRRNTDLARGRLKVINAGWFPELTLPTRKAVFYNLLLNLLSDQPQRQSDIINSAPFKALSPSAKADLLRQTASNHLINRRYTPFALVCLKRSLVFQPNSLKGRVLFELAQRSPTVATFVLAIWQRVRNAAKAIGSLSKRKPKPVPAALVPSAE